jgi:pSer/pThr/pTyr-binding forkhead associated (FHA) protein
MNPLRRIENALAGLVEGGFGRVFRSEVRPMELAHKLAREMDEHATASVSRTYAPNEYSVWLSQRDRARYEGVEHEVIDELCAYLLEHARRESLALASAPRITFHTDQDLRLGEFGIEARMVREPEQASAPSAARSPQPAARSMTPPAARERSPIPREWPPSARQSSPPARGAPSANPPSESPEEGGRTMIYSNAQRLREAVQDAAPPRRTTATLIVSGRRVVLPAQGAVLGRSRDCDVVLDDSSVSRRHARLRPQQDRWTLEDLDSTNGVRVNGRTLRGVQAVRSGDRIELGSTEMLFEVTR